MNAAMSASIDEKATLNSLAVSLLTEKESP
jgi:hypothetical protein